jgi:enolase
MLPVQMGSETYHTLKGLIKEQYGLKAINLADEGGFSPPLSTFKEALTLLVTAIQVSTPSHAVLKFLHSVFCRM